MTGSYGTKQLWHEYETKDRKWGIFGPLFCILAPPESGHHIEQKIVVYVGVPLGAARVFMTKPFVDDIHLLAVILGP